jgi:P4 family phage/plasmid primase-like protien
VDGHFWFWNGTHWAVLPEKILQKKIFNTVVLTKPSANTTVKNLVQEVFSLLQFMQAPEDDLLHFASESPNVVNVLTNELWMLESGDIDIRPHNPASGMRHVLRVDYDPKAKCPEYNSAIKEIFSNSEVTSTLITFCDELMGYAIQLRRNIPLVVVMTGKGNNGKTSILNLLTALVGPDFVHSGRVDELEDSRFAIGNLFGKLLFIDDDVRAGAKLPDGILKKISEAKLLTGERKFKPSFNFVNLAFPILAFNNTPSLADLSLGMMRRLYVLPFLRIFEKNEVDSALFDRIIANELSGVLNRALNGWRRLKQRGQFPQSRDMAAAKEELLAHANPLKGFIGERGEVDVKFKVSLEDFYISYCNWAENSGYNFKQSKSTVKKNLQHLGYEIKRQGVGLIIFGLKLR